MTEVFNCLVFVRQIDLFYHHHLEICKHVFGNCRKPFFMNKLREGCCMFTVEYINAYFHFTCLLIFFPAKRYKK